MTSSPDEDDIPLLEDIVSPDNPVEPRGSPADLIIETLMDDQWKHSYNGLLANARNKISSARLQWSNDKSEEAAQALLDRINLTFEAQIRETINSSLEQHINELREALLQSLRDQLDQLPGLFAEKEDDGPEQ